MIELRQLFRRERSDERGQFLFEHQRQKVAAEGRRPGKAFRRTDYDLRGDAEDAAVDRRTKDGGHVVVVRDERARNDHVVARLVAALRCALSSAIHFATDQGLACSATRAWACAASSAR